MMRRRWFSAWDCLILAFAIVAAVSCLLFTIFGSHGRVAVIRVDNAEVARLDLQTNGQKKIFAGKGYNTVTIEGGACSVSNADCRDLICVHHRKISTKGETIVCLPHKLIVEIE